MTQFVPQPNTDGLVKLTGTIRNLKVTRAYASFVFTETDQTKMGIVAVAAAVAGMGGQAAAMVSNASDIEEAADYLEFDLAGQQVKGWVWRNPFREGDVVSVAASQANEYWETYGITRTKDKIVALYPHCSRGKMQHYKNAFKWWMYGGGGFIILVGAPFFYLLAGNQLFSMREPWIGLAGLMIFFGVMTFSLSRRWLPFVRVAEKVFRALELPNPSSIDLVKSSKAQRTAQDPGEFGTFYFRY